MAPSLKSLFLPVVSQLAPLLAPHRQPTLEDLARTAPTPMALADLEVAAGAPRDLFVRVARRRQALPAQFVAPIAALLGVQLGEVAAAAGAVLHLDAAPREAGFGARALAPLPPDRLLGDPLFPRPLRATAPPTFPGA